MAENMNAVELDMLDILSAAANSDDVETMEREGVVGKPERLNAHFILITYAGLYPDEVAIKLQWLHSFQGRGGGLKEYTIGVEIHPQPADPEKNHHLHAALHATITCMQP